MSADKYIGKVLDNRYEVLEVIGVGGMAIVYRAHCHLLDRDVAIKVLKDEFAQDAEFRRRFYNEAQAVAKLSHNNIVSIYDVSHTDGLEYIVMELIDGITLKEYLQKKGHLSWQESLFFAQQIAKALAHAHSRGIIHQDIKPHNIIILRDGTAKVTDFGIARFAANPETRVMQEAIGSVHYISPEQAKGSTIDYRADIYSLGIVMYEMLTGKLPFDGDTALSIVMQHINATPLLPSEVMEGIPEGMDDIVMHAMCPTVSKRYASANELFNDLERLKNNPALTFGYACDPMRGEQPSMDQTQVLTPEAQAQARQQATQEQAARSSYQQPAPSSAYSGEKQQQAQPSPRGATVATAEEEEEDEKSRRKWIIVGVTAGVVILALLAWLLLRPKTEQVQVPQFVGQQYEAVMANMSYTKSFTIVEADKRVTDNNAEEGEVLSQSVASGTMVASGTRIVLTVCSGKEEEPTTSTPVQTAPKTYTIPSFAGLSVDAVKMQLDAASVQYGFTYTISNEASDDVAKDEVTRTNPAAGKTIPSGTNLVVYVSSGKLITSVTVPSVVGKTEDEARSTLEKQGLKVGDVTEVEGEEEAGVVVSQSVKRGTEVDEGTSVDLEISKGPSKNNDNNNNTNNGNNNTTSNKTVATGVLSVQVPSSEDLGGKTECELRVLCDGTTIYDETQSAGASLSLNLEIDATGVTGATVDKDVSVHADDVFVGEEIVKFTVKN